MRHFKHLTKTMRNQLESLLKANVSKTKIADLLGVHFSTIYREVKRGEYDHLNGSTWIYEKRYSSDLAEMKYRQQLKDKGAPIKLGKDYEYAEYLERRVIEDRLSPGAVLGYIKKHNLKFDTSISVNTFYKYIERGYFSRLSIKHLSGKKKTKKRRTVAIKRAPKGTSIEKRPIDILERKSFGHWEMDCVCGPTKDVLLVLTERLTRKELIFPMQNQTAKNVVKILNSLEFKYGRKFKQIFKSITVDNGPEFSDFNGMERSIFGKKNKRTNVYYCHPYSSYERGTNERINREIRRLIPKGTALGQFSRQDIQYVEDWVNNYPRKVLDFATSNELFQQYMRLIA